MTSIQVLLGVVENAERCNLSDVEPKVQIASGRFLVGKPGNKQVAAKTFEYRENRLARTTFIYILYWLAFSGLENRFCDQDIFPILPARLQEIVNLAIRLEDRG
jgi:hypothetical protein